MYYSFDDEYGMWGGGGGGAPFNRHAPGRSISSLRRCTVYVKTTTTILGTGDEERIRAFFL